MHCCDSIYRSKNQTDCVILPAKLLNSPLRDPKYAKDKGIDIKKVGNPTGVNKITKSVKTNSIVVHGNNNITKPMKKNCVSHGTNNNTKSRIQAKPVKKPRVVDDNTTIRSAVKKHFVTDENDPKLIVLISRKPRLPCAPRRSNLQGLQAKPVTKHRAVDGTNSSTTEFAKEHFLADENDTKPKVLTSRKPPIPCAPRRFNLQGLQTNSVPNHRVVDGTENDTSSDTKPKLLISKKPRIPSVPKRSNLQGLQAKPVTKHRALDGTNNSTIKFAKKHFLADENDTKPKVLSTRKPPISCAPRRSNLQQGMQAKPVTTHQVVDGTDNTSSGIKPKMLTSRKPRVPCAPRCSNLHGLQTSRPTVTSKGCIQKWRC